MKIPGYKPAPIKHKIDPLALPDDHTMCVHFTHVFQPDTQTVLKVACTMKAKEGWLCQDHTTRLLMPRRTATKVNLWNDIADAIIAAETRALSKTRREVVGKKHKIQFIEGLKMKSDPTKVDMEIFESSPDIDME